MGEDGRRKICYSERSTIIFRGFPLKAAQIFWKSVSPEGLASPHRRTDAKLLETGYPYLLNKPQSVILQNKTEPKKNLPTTKDQY